MFKVRVPKEFIGYTKCFSIQTQFTITSIIKIQQSFHHSKKFSKWVLLLGYQVRRNNDVIKAKLFLSLANTGWATNVKHFLIIELSLIGQLNAIK